MRVYDLDVSDRCFVGQARMKQTGSIDRCREMARLDAYSEMGAYIRTRVGSLTKSHQAEGRIPSGERRSMAHLNVLAESMSAISFMGAATPGPEWISSGGTCFSLIGISREQLSRVLADPEASMLLDKVFGEDGSFDEKEMSLDQITVVAP